MKEEKQKENKNNIILDEENKALLTTYVYQYTKCKTNNGYFMRTLPIKNKVKIRILLHHDIIGKPPKGMVVDHINRNTLDNRKENLRFVTFGQNIQNRVTKSKSGFSGVFVSSSCKNGYQAASRFNGKYKYLMFSKNPVFCAIAYDDFQLKCYSNPKLNFPTIRARKKALCEWSKNNGS